MWQSVEEHAQLPPGHTQHFCSCICGLLVYHMAHSTASQERHAAGDALACGCWVVWLTVLGRMGAEAGRVPCLSLQWPVGWPVRWGH